MTSIISIERTTKNGPKRYTYYSIDGIPVNNYMAQRMREKRRAERERLGRPEPNRRDKLAPEVEDYIRTLRKENWNMSAIANQVGTSEYIVRKVVHGN